VTESRRVFANPSYCWKDKYRPDLGQSPWWRIEIRSFSCPKEGAAVPAIVEKP
jgi:hypothetical protein